MRSTNSTAGMSRGSVRLLVCSWLMAVSAALLALPSAPAQAALTAEQIIGRSQGAFLYSGDDAQIRITMKLINPEGKVRLRELTLLRRDMTEGGEQKYFLYFHSPADVRRTAFLVWKYPAKDDDRWLFIPALNLVRRIAAKDSQSSFVGSDFTHEDISGRDVEADLHSLQGDQTLGGKACYVVESTPKTEAGYSRKLSWIDKATFLPLREEHYDLRDELYKVFTADEVKKMGEFWTVTKRTMKNVKSGHRTEVTFTQVRYDVGLTDDTFTERYLRNPPARWIR